MNVMCLSFSSELDLVELPQLTTYSVTPEPNVIKLFISFLLTLLQVLFDFLSLPSFVQVSKISTSKSRATHRW
jgi:hypothetical protein